MISTSFTIYRNDEEITVEVSGHTEYERSPNPHETGIHVVDWSIDSPAGIDLTKAEDAMALEALESCI